MLLSWLGERRTKGCYFLLLVIFIKVNYSKRIKMKIRMISQMDGIGNNQTQGIPSKYPK